MKPSTNILAAVFLSGLTACSTPESKENREPKGCEPQGTVSGAQALDEFDSMVRQVKIGSRCDLKSGATAGSYSLQLQDGRSLAIVLPAPDSASAASLGADREVCGGVPYWRVESQLVSVDGKEATLSWSVRENEKATEAFLLKEAQGQDNIELSDCR